MKRPAMLSLLSFVSCCVLLLLSFGSASAQTPREQSVQGAYTLDRAASDDIEKAIEAVVREMSFLTRPVARKRLRATNLPASQRIVISYTQAEVSIAVDDRAPIRTPANGTPVDWTKEDGEKLEVSTILEGGGLKQTFKGEQGQRVNLYTISADGKRLTVQVSVTSPRLPRALIYKMVYNRIA